MDHQIAPSRHNHPEWSYHANIYEVNLRQYTPEGTFNAFAKHLDRLADMGVRILWLMPITPIGLLGRLGTLGSYYSVLDYKGINPEFGTLEDFKNLVAAAHKRGMRIILDFVANHTANDHPWVTSHPDFYVYNPDGSMLHPHGWTDTSQLNFDNRKVWDALIDAMVYWVRECEIDGYRCDMAHLVPLELWKEARTTLNQIRQDLFWLAECEVPVYHEAFDATYTWKWMHASEHFYQGKLSLERLLSILYRSDVEFKADAFRAYFTSNHDENSWNGTEFEKYGAAASLFAVHSCTWKGIPMIYSGQELPNKKRLEFFEKDTIEWQPMPGLHSFYKTLLELKTRNPALKSGDEPYTTVISQPEDTRVFAYLRKNGADEVLVVLNCSAENLSFTVHHVAGCFKNVFGGSDVVFSGSGTLDLLPWGYLVFEKIKSGEG